MRWRTSGWRVIHDASLGRGNVDHILIGPPGVFTIETKSHPGPVRVARVHGATLSQAQAQRRAIERVTGLKRSRCSSSAARGWTGRWRAGRACGCVPARMLVRLPDEAADRGCRGRRSSARTHSSRKRCSTTTRTAGWPTGAGSAFACIARRSCGAAAGARLIDEHVDLTVQRATGIAGGRAATCASGGGDRDGGHRGDAVGVRDLAGCSARGRARGAQRQACCQSRVRSRPRCSSTREAAGAADAGERACAARCSPTREAAATPDAGERACAAGAAADGSPADALKRCQG